MGIQTLTSFENRDNFLLQGLPIINLVCGSIGFVSYKQRYLAYSLRLVAESWELAVSSMKLRSNGAAYTGCAVFLWAAEKGRCV